MRQEKKDEWKAIVKSIRELTAAQKRTDEQLKRTDEQLKRTDEQLKRTDEQLKRTDEQLKRTDEQLKRTDEQFKRTDEQLKKLSLKVDHALNKIGPSLEMIASHRIMYYVERKLGMTLTEIPESDLIRVNGILIYFDLHGRAEKNGKSYRILGEAKWKARIADVRKFDNDTRPLLKREGKKLIRFIFSYDAPPNARQEAKKLGIIMLSHLRRG